jgi:hypothetical protein
MEKNKVMNIQVTKREMTSDDRYIYSMSRAAHILKVKEVEFVYVCSDNRVLVGLFNDSIYLTALDFKISYAEERKMRGTGFKVTQRVDKKHTYTVRNEDKNTTYKVETFADKIECACQDYKMTKSVMKSNKVACKHVYAVLGHLGYDSLQTYLKGNIQQIAL